MRYVSINKALGSKKVLLVCTPGVAYGVGVFVIVVIVVVVVLLGAYGVGVFVVVVAVVVLLVTLDFFF